MKDLGRYIYEVYYSNLESEMKAYDRIATKRSLKALRFTDDGRTLRVFDGTAKQYFKYINKGRKAGKRPPIAPILRWVKVKLGVSNFKEALSRAWAVATNIAKHGTPKTAKGTASLGMLERVAEKTREEVKERIIEEHRKRIQAAFRGEAVA